MNMIAVLNGLFPFITLVLLIAHLLIIYWFFSTFLHLLKKHISEVNRFHSGLEARLKVLAEAVLSLKEAVLSLKDALPPSTTSSSDEQGGV